MGLVYLATIQVPIRGRDPEHARDQAGQLAAEISSIRLVIGPVDIISVTPKPREKK